MLGFVSELINIDLEFGGKDAGKVHSPAKRRSWGSTPPKATQIQKVQNASPLKIQAK